MTLGAEGHYHPGYPHHGLGGIFGTMLHLPNVLNLLERDTILVAHRDPPPGELFPFFLVFLTTCYYFFFSF